jgi:hypothetical protein
LVYGHIAVTLFWNLSKPAQWHLRAVPSDIHRGPLVPDSVQDTQRGPMAA